MKFRRGQYHKLNSLDLFLKLDTYVVSELVIENETELEGHMSLSDLVLKIDGSNFGLKRCVSNRCIQCHPTFEGKLYLEPSNKRTTSGQCVAFLGGRSINTHMVKVHVLPGKMTPTLKTLAVLELQKDENDSVLEATTHEVVKL